MRGKVVGTQVSLGLHDAPDTLDAGDDVDEMLAQEATRHLDRVAVVERAAKPQTGIAGAMAAKYRKDDACVRANGFLRRTGTLFSDIYQNVL